MKTPLCKLLFLLMFIGCSAADVDSSASDKDDRQLSGGAKGVSGYLWNPTDVTVSFGDGQAHFQAPPASVVKAKHEVLSVWTQDFSDFVASSQTGMIRPTFVTSLAVNDDGSIDTTIPFPVRLDAALILSIETQANVTQVSIRANESENQFASIMHNAESGDVFSGIRR